MNMNYLALPFNTEQLEGGDLAVVCEVLYPRRSDKLLFEVPSSLSLSSTNSDRTVFLLEKYVSLFVLFHIGKM